jgi:hypothetical protein
VRFYVSSAEGRPLLSARRNGVIDMSLNRRKDKQIVPRSLVGMTQGARKRAARAACVGHRFKTKRLKLVWFQCWARDVRGRTKAEIFAMAYTRGHLSTATESDLESLKRYANARANLRIGQKLRPCPGCNMCGDTCGACEDLCPDDTKCLQCGRVMYSAVICDSSGVLPARKATR